MSNASSNAKTQLYNAFLCLKSPQEVENFCIDLMTPQELEALVGRFSAAVKLSEGVPQREVAKSTNISIATVTRVNRFLQRGAGGYRSVISRIFHHTPH